MGSCSPCLHTCIVKRAVWHGETARFACPNGLFCSAIWVVLQRSVCQWIAPFGPVFEKILPFPLASCAVADFARDACSRKPMARLLAVTCLRPLEYASKKHRKFGSFGKKQYLCTAFCKNNKLIIYLKYESIRNRFHFDSRFV